MPNKENNVHAQDKKRIKIIDDVDGIRNIKTKVPQARKSYCKYYKFLTNIV